MTTQRIIAGDCIAGLRTLPDASVHCCVTSPPYWGLRDYGHDGQIGLESTPEAYVARMVEVFREVRRVLADDGTLWLNLGDSYTGAANSGGAGKQDTIYRGEGLPTKKAEGLKPKDLVGIPWRVAFALQADGWWLRQDIIWAKPNPMPESVRDRCTKAHEYVFLLTKSERYFYDAAEIAEKAKDPVGFKYEGGWDEMRKHVEPSLRVQTGNCRTENGTVPHFAAGHGDKRNRRSVWTVTTKPYSGAHFAVMPPDLVELCIKAGTSEEGCCPTCGTPWERVVERERKATRPGAETKTTGDSLVDGNRDPKRHVTETTTTGWQSLCDCDDHQPVPCTVLDPFAGSGTTLAVAAELGRNAIGCELNPEYIGLAERRIKDARSSVAVFEGVPA